MAVDTDSVGAVVVGIVYVSSVVSRAEVHVVVHVTGCTGNVGMRVQLDGVVAIAQFRIGRGPQGSYRSAAGSGIGGSITVDVDGQPVIVICPFDFCITCVVHVGAGLRIRMVDGDTISVDIKTDSRLQISHKIPERTGVSGNGASTVSVVHGSALREFSRGRITSIDLGRRSNSTRLSRGCYSLSRRTI